MKDLGCSVVFPSWPPNLWDALVLYSAFCGGHCSWHWLPSNHSSLVLSLKPKPGTGDRTPVGWVVPTNQTQPSCRIQRDRCLGYSLGRCGRSVFCGRRKNDDHQWINSNQGGLLIRFPGVCQINCTVFNCHFDQQGIFVFWNFFDLRVVSKAGVEPLSFLDMRCCWRKVWLRVLKVAGNDDQKTPTWDELSALQTGNSRSFQGPKVPGCSADFPGSKVMVWRWTWFATRFRWWTSLSIPSFMGMLPGCSRSGKLLKNLVFFFFGGGRSSLDVLGSKAAWERFIIAWALISQLAFWWDGASIGKSVAFWAKKAISSIPNPLEFLFMMIEENDEGCPGETSKEISDSEPIRRYKEHIRTSKKLWQASNALVLTRAFTSSN